MKKFMTIFALTVLSLSLHAQTLPQNVIKNISSKGRVTIQKNPSLAEFEEDKPFVMREYHDVGKVTIDASMGKAKVYCQAVVVTNVKTGEKAGFCRISTRPKLGFASLGGKDKFAVIFLTYRELDECAASMTYVRDSLMASSRDKMVECRYRTDGMQTITFTYDPSSEKWKMSIGGHGCRADRRLMDYFLAGVRETKKILDEKLSAAAQP